MSEAVCEQWDATLSRLKSFVERQGDRRHLRGFTGGGDKILIEALGSTIGFAIVLAAAEARFEHGGELLLEPSDHPAIKPFKGPLVKIVSRSHPLRLMT